MVRVVRQRLEKINLLGGFVEAFEKSIPAEGGALDAHRKLDHTLQRFDVAEFDLLINRLAVFRKRHHVLKATHESTHLFNRLAFNSNRHHRS